jgi:hypothetical protein
MGERGDRERNASNILVEKPEWKRPLGKLGVDNIRMDLGGKLWRGFIYLR